MEHGQYKPTYDYYYVRSTGCFFRAHQDPPPWIERWPIQLDPSQVSNATAYVAEAYETEHELFAEFQL